MAALLLLLGRCMLVSNKKQLVLTHLGAGVGCSSRRGPELGPPGRLRCCRTTKSNTSNRVQMHEAGCMLSTGWYHSGMQ
jgi:hypothetical protein